MLDNYSAFIFSIKNVSKNGLIKMNHVLYAGRIFIKNEQKKFINMYLNVIIKIYKF